VARHVPNSQAELGRRRRRRTAVATQHVPHGLNARHLRGAANCMQERTILACAGACAVAAAPGPCASGRVEGVQAGGASGAAQGGFAWLHTRRHAPLPRRGTEDRSPPPHPPRVTEIRELGPLRAQRMACASGLQMSRLACGGRQIGSVLTRAPINFLTYSCGAEFCLELRRRRAVQVGAARRTATAATSPAAVEISSPKKKRC